MTIHGAANRENGNLTLKVPREKKTVGRWGKPWCVFWLAPKRNGLISWGDILEEVTGYRFPWICLETKIGTYWRMPEPWLPFFSKGPLLITLHGIHCYSENGQTHKVHICYCWPCDLSSIQTFPWEKLRKAVIIAPYPDQLVVIFLIFYIPPLWETFQLTDHSAKQKKRCSPDRKVHQLLRIPFFHFNLLDNFAWECVRRPIEQRLSTLLGSCLNKNPSLTNPGEREKPQHVKMTSSKILLEGQMGLEVPCYIHLGIHRTSSNLLCPNHILNGWKWRGGGFNPDIFWFDVSLP